MKAFLKKYLPTQENVHKYPYLQGLMSKLQQAPVWRMDRNSIAKGAAIGLLICYLPLPCQMLLSAILACFFRANVSLAILITWISNPLTFVPITFFICQVGAWVLGTNNTFPKTLSPVEWTHEGIQLLAHDLYLWFYALGKVYLVGLPIVAFGSALLGYLVVQLGWRMAIYWRRRHRAAQ